MQDHAKYGYTFGNLSLIRSLALDISNEVTTMRDRKNASKKIERFLSVFKGTSFFR